MNHTQKIAFGDATFLKSDAKEHIFWGTDKKHPNLGTPLNTVYNLSMIIPKISYYNYASYSHKHKKEAPISGNLQLDKLKWQLSCYILWLVLHRFTIDYIV